MKSVYQEISKEEIKTSSRTKNWNEAKWIEFIEELIKKDRAQQLILSGVVKPFYCWNSKCDGKRCKNQCMGCEYYEEKELKQ
jgi:hypothetical protein